MFGYCVVLYCVFGETKIFLNPNRLLNIHCRNCTMSCWTSKYKKKKIYLFKLKYTQYTTLKHSVLVQTPIESIHYNGLEILTCYVWRKTNGVYIVKKLFLYHLRH